MTGSDPIVRFRRWMAFARRRGEPLAEAVALATSDRQGRPAARFVLLKGVDERGFVFYTDTRSRKGRDLRHNPRAALAFYWDVIGRQVRVEGRVSPVTPEEADAYWERRPRESRLAATASHQGRPLASRAALVRRWRTLRARVSGHEVPRPIWWSGYRLIPSTIEFWTRREHRLHERELFVRRGRCWSRRHLQP